jgi:hypothetical protein
MYGKKYMGVARTTYLIGPDGKVAARFDKVKPEGHADEILAAALGSASCTPSKSVSAASTKARSSPPTKPSTRRASTSTPASKRR